VPRAAGRRVVELRLASCLTELPALDVAEPEAAASEFLPQDGVLGEQVLDDLLLLLVGEPGDTQASTCQGYRTNFMTVLRGGGRPCKHRLDADPAISAQVPWRELFEARRAFFTLRVADGVFGRE
jgi:hypothetical protein